MQEKSLTESGSGFGYATLSPQGLAAVSEALKKSNMNGDAGLTREATQKLGRILEEVYVAQKGVLPAQPFDMQATIDWFTKWAGAYAQNSRFFHNLDHLKDMTQTPKAPYGDLATLLDLKADEMIRLQHLNVLAALYHDVEYVHVDGTVTEQGKQSLSQHFVEPGANGSWKVKEDFGDNKHREVINMVLQVFGKEKGQVLSPFAGMNEMFSAMEAAIDLSDKGMAREDVLHIVAAIEATIPFQPKDRMNKLRERISAAKEKFGLELKERDLDKIIGSATILANQDVIGLAGGMRPGEEVTADHVREVLKGTDKLHREEIPALRTSTPGDYPANELAKGLLKQHTLFNHMLKEGSASEVFHSVTFSDGQQFPPQKELEAHEAVVREKVAPILGLILRARLAAVRAIAGIAQRDGLAEKKMRDYLDPGFPKVEASIDPEKPPRNEKERIAFDVLFNEREAGPHDTPRSLLAAKMLQSLGEEGLRQLVPDVDLNPQHPDRVAINGGDHAGFTGKVEALVAEGKISDIKKMTMLSRDPVQHYMARIPPRDNFGSSVITVGQGLGF